MSEGEGGDLALPDLNDPVAVASWRQQQHDAWGEDVLADEPAHVETIVAGTQCLMAGPESAPVVVYLHGGGFCLGSPRTVVPITARLARRCRVISVDYRLAPEYPFPAGLDDARGVFDEVSSWGPAGLAGDSAGANLALGVALDRLRTGSSQPAGLALLSPLLDMRAQPVGDDANRMRSAYLGPTLADDVRASPLAAPDDQLSCAGPMLVQATDAEPLYPQAEKLVARVSTAGGDATLAVWSGLWHAWHYHRDLPEAWAAVDAAALWLARAVGGFQP